MGCCGRGATASRSFSRFAWVCTLRARFCAGALSATTCGARRAFRPSDIDAAEENHATSRVPPAT